MHCFHQGVLCGLTRSSPLVNDHRLSVPLCLPQALLECSPAVMFVAHSESSAGLLQDVEGFGPLCQK